MKFASLALLSLASSALAKAPLRVRAGPAEGTQTSTNANNGNANSAANNNGNNAGTSTSTSSTASSTAVSAEAVLAIAFENVGYTGYYYDVASYSDITSDDCSCELLSSFTAFTGTNAPLDEELSVHFRGPISLELFAYYTSSDSSSGTWTQQAYYSASAQNATNVTFLTAAGTDSVCLGKALTYAGANGTAEADSSTILEADNLIPSNSEYMIFSSVECPSSGADNSCGFYRSGIPAYHGFYGSTKMFLFEFEMPDATDDEETNHDMPAIWFLNAKIPRTSQYPTNTSCSCWTSGCGELDIFEVMNTTTTGMLFSTIHDYQGTSEVQTGMQAPGYFPRNTTGTMKGGVVFGSDKTITIFLLDDLEFSDTLSASAVSAWYSSDEEAVQTLSSASLNTSTSASKKSGGGIGLDNGYLAAVMSFFFLALMYF